jgi:hypothetical protein
MPRLIAPKIMLLVGVCAFACSGVFGAGKSHGGGSHGGGSHGGGSHGGGGGHSHGSSSHGGGGGSRHSSGGGSHFSAGRSSGGGGSHFFGGAGAAAAADLVVVDRRVVRRWRDRAGRDPTAVAHTEAGPRALRADIRLVRTVAAATDGPVVDMAAATTVRGVQRVAPTVEVRDLATATAGTTVALAPTAHRDREATLAALTAVSGRAVRGTLTRIRGT